MTDPISDRASSIRRPPGRGRWCSLWAVALIALLSASAHMGNSEDMQYSSIIHLTGSNMNLDAHLVCIRGRVRIRSCPYSMCEPGDRPDRRPAAASDRQKGVRRRSARRRGSPRQAGTTTGPSRFLSAIAAGARSIGRPPAAAYRSANGAGGVKIAGNSACIATVMATNSGSRFCASLEAPPNCTEAQNDHVALVDRAELRRQPAMQLDASGRHLRRLRHQHRADLWAARTEAWKADSCAKAGGASYNLPVELSCSGQPSDPGLYLPGTGPGQQCRPAGIYDNCGNPDATCVGNSRACVNAYFFPMFSGSAAAHQPVGVCSGGRTLTVTFFAGH